MTIEVKVIKNGWANEKQPLVRLHNTETLNLQAEFARELILRWGMVAAIQNGEDSAGRHQLKLLTPQEVVDRAMEVTLLTFKAFHDNDMIVKIPTIEEMQEIADKIETPTARERIKDMIDKETVDE